MKYLLLSLLLLLCGGAAHAQSTLGLTLSELRSLYQRSPSMTGWKVGSNAQNETYVLFEDSRDNTVIASYFTPVNSSLEDLVTATMLMGPAEKFMYVFAEDCNQRYAIMGHQEWLDTKNRLRVVLRENDGMAVLRFTVWHK
jgi:hypothetical protein